MPTPIAVDTPVVIEARGVEKAFRIPEHRIDSFKERAVHPFARPDYRELRALRGVSFDVRRGEFFGIVGRNGSGKSTLLKILASIYRADSGQISIAGRMAPFIELGVGFDAELTARENVVLNGVMIGLSRREAARRLDAVLEFAELGEFVELKLKNYSSGMMVRLAFAVMIQADADILLIDEVLAVGDAAFQQKCADVFRELRDAGKTIVLVSHDMGAVEEHCHRGMLLEEGELRYVGEPEQVGRRYFRLNFAQTGAEVGDDETSTHAPEEDVRVVSSWLVNRSGERVTSVEQGEPLRFGAVVEALREVPDPAVGFVLRNVDGVHVSGFGAVLRREEDARKPLSSGERIRVTAEMENPLRPGRYFLSCWVCRNRNPADVVLRVPRLLDLVVFGADGGAGVVSLETECEIVAEPKRDR